MQTTAKRRQLEFYNHLLCTILHYALRIWLRFSRQNQCCMSALPEWSKDS